MTALVTAAVTAVAGVLLLGAAFLLRPQAAPCLVAEAGRCLDPRLTGRAAGYVSSIDVETPGEPLWYVAFEVGDDRVLVKVADWPAAPGGPANGPRVGSAVNVAYDPAAPATRVTDADALAALRARPATTTWTPATTAAGLVGLLLLVAAGWFLVGRRPGTDQEAGTPDGGPPGAGPSGDGSAGRPDHADRADRPDEPVGTDDPGRPGNRPGNRPGSRPGTGAADMTAGPPSGIAGPVTSAGRRRPSRGARWALGLTAAWLAAFVLVVAAGLAIARTTPDAPCVSDPGATEDDCLDILLTEEALAEVARVTPFETDHDLYDPQTNAATGWWVDLRFRTEEGEDVEVERVAWPVVAGAPVAGGSVRVAYAVTDPGDLVTSATALAAPPPASEAGLPLSTPLLGTLWTSGGLCLLLLVGTPFWARRAPARVAVPAGTWAPPAYPVPGYPARPPASPSSPASPSPSVPPSGSWSAAGGWQLPS